MFKSFFDKVFRENRPIKQPGIDRDNLDWRKSKAHMLLLSKFINPKAVANFADNEEWKGVLQENPEKAIKRFIDGGVLVRADLHSLLDYKYKATELKAILKSFSLPISGRKSDLIQRFIQTKPDEANKLVAGLYLWALSESGKIIIIQYLKDAADERFQVEQKAMNFLIMRQFEDAIMLVANFESIQVFPRGMGIDWVQYDLSTDIEVLNDLFKRTPKVLAKLGVDSLEQLRIAAGMMYLWGINRCSKWLPVDFKIELSMDAETAALKFLLYMNNRINLVNYSRNSHVVIAVEIIGGNDSCEKCKELSGKRYKFDEAPELPYENCTNNKGCRCTYVPVTIFT